MHLRYQDSGNTKSGKNMDLSKNIEKGSYVSFLVNILVTLVEFSLTVSNGYPTTSSRWIIFSVPRVCSELGKTAFSYYASVGVETFTS